MTETTDKLTDLLANVQVVQDAVSDSELVRAADPEARGEEIRNGTSGCVNHLCGCR